MTTSRLKMEEPKEKIVQLVASGDARLAPNQVGWAAQKELENALTTAISTMGFELIRCHPFDPAEKHGFIESQAQGMKVFRDGVNPHQPIIVATAIWQYSNHVLPGLTKHRAPVLTVANWNGQWPGLVGMLNLNGSLTKAGVEYSSIWSKDFTDAWSLRGIESWVNNGTIPHDLSHVRTISKESHPWSSDYDLDKKRGVKLGQKLRFDQAILGVFDEGCMGMYNAIIPDKLLQPLGIFKERMSQSTLYAAMLKVKDDTVQRHYQWLLEKGMKFDLGTDSETELTEDQVLEGLKMYDAAAQIADEKGCSVIGIQYQHGLQELCVSSDLAEGLLNNPERPPVFNKNNEEIMPGEPIVHFNEVDECAALDALVTNMVWSDMKLDPATTLHDVRWGDYYKDETVDGFIWLFEISGAVPPNHLIGGYKGAVGERQPPMYFRRGGATIKGISRPGEIVWSRIYVENDALHMDIGRGGVVKLPKEESQRRWEATTPQWPIMHALLYGISRDQFMAKHKANHVQVVYAPDEQLAQKALVAKVSMAQELGIEVNLCGNFIDGLKSYEEPLLKTNKLPERSQ